MSARDPDDLLRDGGGEIGDLYRRLPRYEPPRRLDRAVLNEAARAVHSGKPPRRQRWIIGVGSAAGLVLAAGLAWRIGHEPMTENEVVAPTAAPRVVPVQPLDESSRRKHEAPTRDAAAAPASEAVPPAAAQPQAAGAVSEPTQTKPMRRQRAESRPAPPPMQSEAPPPAAAPPPTAFPADEREQARDADKSQRADAGIVTQAPGAAAAEKRAATSNAFGRASPTLPSSSVELQRDMQLAPSQWLAHVRDLMQQGRRQQATESLRLFVRTHPDRRVPDDLRELLE